MTSAHLIQGQFNNVKQRAFLEMCQVLIREVKQELVRKRLCHPVHVNDGAPSVHSAKASSDGSESMEVHSPTPMYSLSMHWLDNKDLGVQGYAVAAAHVEANHLAWFLKRHKNRLMAQKCVPLPWPPQPNVTLVMSNPKPLQKPYARLERQQVLDHQPDASAHADSTLQGRPHKALQC